MARSRAAKARRPLRKVRPRARPHPTPSPPAPPPAPPPFDDPLVEQLTGDILQHLGAANSHSVTVRAEIGKLLLQVRTTLPHGAYRPYLATHVPFTPTTAERAVNLHRFRDKHPTLFEKLRPVGLSKANVVISRPIAEVEALLSQTHPVPTTGVNKTLLAMTFDEMMAIIHGPPNPTDQPANLLRNYRRTGRRFMHALDALVDDSPNIPPEDLTDLHEELRLVLSRFAATFDLRLD